MNLSALRDSYFPQILDIIPSIINDHFIELRQNPELNNFIVESPTYATSLEETFRTQGRALFYDDNDYLNFIRESEKTGYELGRIYATKTQLTMQQILLLTNSTRICSLRHFLKVLHGVELTPITGLLIERVFELSNYRQNAFFDGFVQQRNQKLRSESITDPLTNVFNRRHFYDRAIEEMKRAYRIKYPLSLMLIDIDNLKLVNDEHGHLEGDRLLKHFAKVVSRIRANFDSIFRFGGDEFILLLPNCTEENAIEIGRRLDVELQNFNKKASLSFGTVTLPLLENPEELNIDYYINLADSKMYESKHASKKVNS
ncbi:GGDEF domain-containing protein [Fredinandcohnia sp. 179-A 10B2 NHS]|uniref:GGDEF domain-containing protein n=1 Tax=Fredinandcohnia sp. 179-A 10B2 NHS TaxID=3235176 RepID=UPI0039A1C893